MVSKFIAIEISDRPETGSKFTSSRRARIGLASGSVGLASDLGPVGLEGSQFTGSIFGLRSAFGRFQVSISVLVAREL